MNPFIAFLILVPLLVSLAFWAVTVMLTMREGFTGSAIAMHIIFGGLSAALVYLLVRSSKGPLLDDEPIRHLDIESRRRLTNSWLIMTYFVMFALLAVVTNLQSARNWIGAVSFVMALSMVISAVFELVQARKLPATNPIDPNAVELKFVENLRSNYRKTTNSVFLASISVAVSCTYLFLNFDGSRYISSFDLIGLLTWLFSVNVWFFVKARTISAGDGAKSR